MWSTSTVGIRAIQSTQIPPRRRKSRLLRPKLVLFLNTSFLGLWRNASIQDCSQSDSNEKQESRSLRIKMMKHHSNLKIARGQNVHPLCITLVSVEALKFIRRLKEFICTSSSRLFGIVAMLLMREVVITYTLTIATKR